MSQVSHIYPKCPKCFICPKCLLYIPSVPNVPESQMAHMSQMSHVSQMAHMSEVSQVFQMSHVSQLSHVFQMSCVSQMSDVSKKNKALQIMMENTSAMANINHMGVQGHLLWLPLYTQRWGHFGFTSVLSVCSVCPIYFCQSVQSFLSCRRSNTRRWPNAGLMFAHCLRRWPNISPVLGYRVVFGATLNVGQRHSRRANIYPALVQSIVSVLPACRCRQREVLTRTEWILASTDDAGPTFNRHWVGVGL